MRLRVRRMRSMAQHAHGDADAGVSTAHGHPSGAPLHEASGERARRVAEIYVCIQTKQFVQIREGIFHRTRSLMQKYY